MNCCAFKDKARIEEEIVDQIIFGTNSDTLRAELLRKEVSLEEALSKGRLQEGVVSQMKVFTPSMSSSNVNRVELKESTVRGPLRRCFNCGRQGHMSNDLVCPARGKECMSQLRK